MPDSDSWESFVLTFVSFLGTAQSPPDPPKMEKRSLNTNTDQTGDVGRIPRRVTDAQKE